MKYSPAVIGAIVFTLLATAVSVADIAPKLVNYQGRLTDAVGNPVEGTISILFSIYGSAEGNDLIWQETHSNVEVTDGLFNVLLGAGDVPMPLDDAIFSSSERWLGIKVGAEPEISPRTRLVSVPYSERVNTVDQAKGGVISGSLEIETPPAKQGETETARLIIRGDAGDSVVISPGDDIGLIMTDDQGDEAVLITGASTGGAILVTATDAAKTNGEVIRTVEISPSKNVVLKATEANNDVVVLITSNESGGAVEITASDVAKANPNVITGSVLINEQGIFFVNNEETDTTLAILVNGDITGDGQIVMGENSSSTGEGSSVFGQNNSATGNYSTVAGGRDNEVQADYAAILGGYTDTIFVTGHYSYLFGIGSRLSGDSTFMVDMPHIRFGDEISGYEFPSFAGGNGQLLVIDGAGQLNWITPDFDGGGWVKQGSDVVLESSGDSVGIGTVMPTEKLDVDGNIHASGTISSGNSITIDGGNDRITASGGRISFDDDDIVTTGRATFGPNQGNSGEDAFAAGRSHTVSGMAAAVGGGEFNNATGMFSSVPGGRLNRAAGDYSFAAGNQAQALHTGSVVITANSDSQGSDSVATGGEEQMVLRADGGVYITDEGGSAPYDPDRLVNTSTGAFLGADGVWTNAPSLDMVENVTPIDRQELLDKIAALPIMRWNSKNLAAVQHIGPLAEDFFALFTVGDDESISTIDPAGIALAAIQLLYQTAKDHESQLQRIDELESQVSELSRLRSQVAEMQVLIQNLSPEQE